MYKTTPPTFLDKPVMNNQCCVNNITAANAARVEKVSQLCQQILSSLLPSGSEAEVIEIAD